MYLLLKNIAKYSKRSIFLQQEKARNSFRAQGIDANRNQSGIHFLKRFLAKTPLAIRTFLTYNELW